MEIDDKEFQAEMRKMDAQFAENQQKDMQIASAINGLYETMTYTLVATGINSLEEVYSDDVTALIDAAMARSGTAGRTDMLKAIRILTAAAWRFTRASSMHMREKGTADDSDNPVMI